MSLVCTNFDKCPNPYVRDLRWVVILSDDSCVWQDDNNPEYEEPSSWLRLRHFLKDKPELFVKRVLLEFWGHMEIIEIEDNVKGVFFRKAIGGDVMSASTQDFYIFGKLIENNNIEELSVDWWMTPELILHRTEKRLNIADHEDHLIRRAVQ